MTRITLDDVLRSKLGNLGQTKELCDESGRVIARIVPKVDLSEYDLEPQISREELLRRSQSNQKTYTTAEVLAHLESL